MGPAERIEADALLSVLSSAVGQGKKKILSIQPELPYISYMASALLCLTCATKCLFAEPRGRRGAAEVSDCGIRMAVFEILKSSFRKCPVSLFQGIV